MKLSELIAPLGKLGPQHLRATNVSYGVAHKQSYDVYARADLTSAPVVLFWHGGSWNGGDKSSYGFVGNALASLGYVAIVPNYRLYPEVRFPTFIEDAAAVVGDVYTKVHRWGGDRNHLFAVGHSAGAHTAAALTYDPRYIKAVGLPSNTISGFIGISGPYDLVPTGGYRKIFPMEDAAQPWRIARLPIHSPAPALLLHGLTDRIVLPHHSKRLARHVRAHGGAVTLRLSRFHEHFSIMIAFLWPVSKWSHSIRSIRKFVSDNS